MSAQPQTFTIHEANQALLECLSTATPTRPALSDELILQIIDHPTRWIEIHTTIMPSPSLNRTCISVSESSSPKHIIHTEPLSSNEIARIRSIVFTFRSKDQGRSWDKDWYGTYDHSWTWFEAGLARYDLDDSQSLVPLWKEGCKSHDIQRNRHAGKQPEDYRIELGKEHPLLQSLEEGDRIALCACARFDSWTNNVYSAGITVWCVDDLS